MPAMTFADFLKQQLKEELLSNAGLAAKLNHIKTGGDVGSPTSFKNSIIVPEINAFKSRLESKLIDCLKLIFPDIANTPAFVTLNKSWTKFAEVISEAMAVANSEYFCLTSSLKNEIIKYSPAQSCGYEVDGGFANSVYLVVQLADGGGAVI